MTLLVLMAELNETPSEAALEACLLWATSNSISEDELVSLVSLVEERIGLPGLSANQRTAALTQQLLQKLEVAGGDGARAAAAIAHSHGMESARRLQALSSSLPSAFASQPRKPGVRVRAALNAFRSSRSEDSARVVLSLLQELVLSDEWFVSMVSAFAEELVRANLAAGLVAQDLLGLSAKVTDRSALRALAALAQARGEPVLARALQQRALESTDHFSMDEHHWLALSEARRHPPEAATPEARV